MSDYRQLVEESIQKCESSAAGLRVAAKQVANNTAKNSFEQAAKELEETVSKCKIALKQLY
ncbi:MAG TPA: hypothetical protein GX699_10915 [Firmicutes bacterium]|nr:hypothetical protein [Bacillota bacterium]